MNNDTLFTASSWAQIISVIVAVLAIIISIIVTVWVYLRSKQKRELTCSFGEIITPIELKSGDAFKGDITILYRGQPVENLFVVRATLKNTGNQPIRESEVVEPITFTFPVDTQIIKEPQVIQRKPENLKVKGQLNQSEANTSVNSVTIKIPLFNPGESLTVDFVCTGKVAEPKVLTRIEGISSVHIIREHAASAELSRWNAEYDERLRFVFSPAFVITFFLLLLLALLMDRLLNLIR